MDLVSEAIRRRRHLGGASSKGAASDTSTMALVTRSGRRLRALLVQRRLGAQLALTWALSSVVIATLRPSFVMDDSTPPRLSGMSILWLLALCAVATVGAAYAVEHWKDP